MVIVKNILKVGTEKLILLLVEPTLGKILGICASVTDISISQLMGNWIGVWKLYWYCPTPSIVFNTEF
jgi:hypothetical protein